MFLETIDAVIVEMERVMQRCLEEKSKLGYFSVLYYNVTLRVRDAIKAGRFEDPVRMERLDVIFACRYLDAINAYWQGKPTSASWDVAFKAASSRSPVILQRLLLGMNAHINFDLSIAAAKTSPGASLPALQRDFQEIMNLLNEMIDAMSDRIEKVSPIIRILDKMGGRTDEYLCGFGIKAARDIAWKAAERLAVADEQTFEQQLKIQDKIVAELGKRILRPGIWLSTGLFFISLSESQDVPKVMDTLRM